jgi:hypothetical protein
MVGLLCACAAALAVVWPNDVYAQRRVRFYRARPAVFVSAGFSYWPAGPYYWGWYPYAYGWYPPPYYYGYGYGYGYRDDWSSARVEVTPKDAQVYVDGYFVGIVDDFDGFLQRLRVEPGEHEIQFYREGYRTITDKVLFRPGQSYRIKYALQPLAPGEPNEARPQPAPGVAPRQPAAPRGYPAAPRRPGPGRDYPPPPQQPEGPPPVERGDVSSSFGTLSVRVQPADAAITVDGERWDSPEGGSRLVIQLPEGTHRVEIHKDGFKDYSRTIDVRRGEVTTLNVSLASEVRP